ncbi:MAG: threonine synthase [Myxococcales bacterium]|nr:threonine synthase [Myxococcales bacterium]
MSSPNFSAWFRCFAGCGATYPLTEILVRCRGCGGLLDVVHDEAAWQERSADAWRALLSARASSAAFLDQSGVWAQREWVLPALTDADIVSLGEGRVPLVPMPTLGRELGCEHLWIKQCGHNPTGSFKDVGMTALVSMVQALRRNHRIAAIACASTGDTSAALSAYAARAGIPAIVFLPADKVSDEQLAQPLSSFATTCALDTDFDGCMRLVAEFCGRHGVYLANSMNPLRIEGQKTLSVEICQQLGWQVPDWIIVPSGNLGHVTAIGKGFKLLRTVGLIDRLPRLCAAQAQASAPLYAAFKNEWRFHPTLAGPTQASAIRIGHPVNVDKAIATLKDFAGVVEQASEDEITQAWLQGDRHGLYADPHTGVALAALRHLREQDTVRSHERVVVISTAHGLKFSGQKLRHHRPERLESPLRTQENVDPERLEQRGVLPHNSPQIVAPRIDALEDVLLPRLQRASS